MEDRIHLQQLTKSAVAAVDPRLRSNAAAVVLDDFIVAVDVGMRPCAARLLRTTLEEEFRRPVRFVCLTHYHADHAYGLQPFRDVALFASAQIAENLRQSLDWSPEALARWKQEDPDGGEWLDEVEFIIPTVLFRRQLDITNNDRVLEFHHSGGHTSCSVYGYLPDEKVIFSGDLVFSGMFPYAGDPSADPEIWISTLKTWLHMDVDHVIPGHGPTAGSEEVRQQLEFFETLKRNTIEAIQAGRDHTGIILPAMYPIAEEKKWFAEKTAERWHSYYRSWS